MGAGRTETAAQMGRGRQTITSYRLSARRLIPAGMMRLCAWCGRRLGGAAGQRGGDPLPQLLSSRFGRRGDSDFGRVGGEGRRVCAHTFRRAEAKAVSGVHWLATRSCSSWTRYYFKGWPCEAGCRGASCFWVCFATQRRPNCSLARLRAPFAPDSALDTATWFMPYQCRIRGWTGIRSKRFKRDDAI